MSIETELKLSARASDLPALRRALKKMASGRPVKRSNLVSTYYETADRAVAGRGLVLRIREQDGRFVQTIKSQQIEAAPLSRGEWEDVVAGDRPDPHAPESGRFVPAEIADRLAPMFRTIVQRDSIELSPGPGTRIEAAVDRGEIRPLDGAQVDRISEIELELKEGDVAALYDVALQLLATSPVRIARRSKAQRGYTLVDGAPAAPAARAAVVDLDPQVTAEEALRRIGPTCLDQILDNEAAVLAGVPDAVHQMRVAIRRLRAALTGFCELLPEDERRWATDELRWLADILGEARNLDVFESAILAPVQQAASIAGSVAERGQFELLAGAAERRRRIAYAAAQRAVRSGRYAELILRLYRWFEGGAWPHCGGAAGWQRPIAEVAPALLRRREKRVKPRLKHFRRQSAEERHRLRIALKKLRYMAELLASLYPTRKAEKYTSRLKRAQDDLGDENDVHLAQILLPKLIRGSADRHTLEIAGQRIVNWHQHRIAENRGGTRRNLRRLRHAETFWHA